ncbi:MAG: nicotinate-nucleotide--dimethylbenzimidazole phosphoribosyltransferase [Rhodospirillales bacterium]|nr:nicotinate-nucleotide--dimethylbenzimidazole phosphoribosyltransferase [Rhodospirillales bacterium]
MTDQVLPLEEIKALIAKIEPLPKRGKGKDIPPALAWLQRSQQKCTARLNHPRTALFCGHHGFAFDDETAKQDAQAYLAGCQDGNSKLHDLCQFANADLRLYEMNLTTPTADAFQESAMSDDAMVTAMAYGMMMTEKGPDLLAAGAFGAGTNKAAAAVLALIAGQNDDLAAAVRARTNNQTLTALEALREAGGFEIAALTGMILAARLASVPVLLDSLAGLAALAALAEGKPEIADHCAFCGTAPDNLMSWVLQNTSLTVLPPIPGNNEPGVAAALQIPQLKALTLLQVNKHAA